MLKMTPRLLYPVIGLLMASSVLSANRFREYTERYATPDRPATPMVASYLGGQGDNHLIAGDFLPDGTLFLAGNAYGPGFSLPGITPTVLGSDTTPPEFSMPMRNDQANPPEAWKYRDGAGFIIALSSDYQQIARAIRLPWGSGVVTDLVTDDRGHLFVTGTVGSQFSALGDFRELSPDDVEDAGKIFFGRLKTDLSGFEWLLKLPDATDNTPQLRHIGEGVISLVGANGYHFDASGEILRAQPIGISNAWARGVCFKTFAHLVGHFHRSRTGWEPWHRPIVVIHNPDRSLRFRFYQWDARTVGTNWSRLVSDSRMQVATFDLNGQPIIGGWSDGGNSVWTRVPYDITRSAPAAITENTGQSSGLPFSTWGANVGSFAHLNRLDYETGNPLSYTLFIAYLASRNAPSSVMMHNLDVTVDNELLISGSSAYGLIQTRDLVVNSLDYESDYIGNDYFALLNENWTDIRFSSAVPGSRQVALERHSNEREGRFRFGSAHVNGKTRVVAVSGARFDEKFKPISPLASFGSGSIDGLFVVLEMESSERLPEPTFKYPTSSSQTTRDTETDESLSGVFLVGRDMRNSDSILALKDTTGKKWPLIYRGNPVGQNLVNAAGRGTFVLRAENDRVQLGEEGSTGQSRRLGGSDGGAREYPTLEVEITLLSNQEATGKISFNGHTVTSTGPVGIRSSRPSGQGIQLQGNFRITKGDLGLNDEANEASEELILEWWAPGRPAPDNVQEDVRAPAPDRPPERPTNSTPATTPTPSSEEFALRTWTNQAGQEVEATYRDFTNHRVTLELANGQEAQVAWQDLSADDQAYVLKVNNLRVWTSADGREMIARKIEASGENVTVVTPAGQQFTINLATLSDEDRAFVRNQ